MGLTDNQKRLIEAISKINIISAKIEDEITLAC
jgi:hypothetical protein